MILNKTNAHDLRRSAQAKLARSVVLVTDVINCTADVPDALHRKKLGAAVRAMCEARELLACLKGEIDALANAATYVLSETEARASRQAADGVRQ